MLPNLNIIIRNTQHIWSFFKEKPRNIKIFTTFYHNYDEEKIVGPCVNDGKLLTICNVRVVELFVVLELLFF